MSAACKDDSPDTAPRRQVDLTTAIGAALVTALLGGGGAVASASSVSAELRETRAEIVGRLDRLDDRYADQTARVAALEARLRDLELARAAAPR